MWVLKIPNSHSMLWIPLHTRCSCWAHAELGFMPHFSSDITHSLETGKIKAGKIQWFWDGGVRIWISGGPGLEEPLGVCYGAVGM